MEDLESAQPESLGSHPRQGRGQLSILVPDVGALSVAESGKLSGPGQPRGLADQLAGIGAGIEGCGDSPQGSGAVAPGASEPTS